MQLIIVFRAVLASFHNYHLLVEEKPYLIQLYQFGGPPLRDGSRNHLAKSLL